MFKTKKYYQQQNIKAINFPTDIESIRKRIEDTDPILYGKTRNYGDGAVTYLSPYISRGVISTKQVYNYIMSLDLPWQKIEKLVQELAWRDYWQQVWLAKGDEIHTDLKNTQSDVFSHNIPKAIVEADTGINVVDEAIKTLYTNGYMHNHMRMYVASICCNISKCHWLTPARWMYSHLLDGDLASNQLSWQWVTGAFSNKKYYANQGNINKFFDSDQTGTFLDVDYSEFPSMEIPKKLEETVEFENSTKLPDTNKPELDRGKKTLVYNYYNLDPSWHKEKGYQRVLMLEPSVFEKYPVSEKNIDFVLNLARNIEGIKVFVGEFNELEDLVSSDNIICKEHPLNKHYKGKEETRDWISSVKGYHSSFFSYWKKAKKEL